MALLLFLAATPALSQIRSDQAVAPLVFGAAAATQDSARVASDGTDFFAVMRTHTSSTSVRIIASRVSPAGEILNQPSIVIASGLAATLGSPDVVFVGGNFLVVYPTGTSVAARRFSRDGRPIDSQPVLISNTTKASWVATNGKNVYLPTARNRFRLLAADGTPGVEHVVPNGGSGSFSVASNGDRYLIGYALDYRGQPPGVIVVLDGNGGYLAAKPIPFADPLQWTASLTAASNGSSFLLHIATRLGSVGFMLVDADGNAGAFRTLDDRPGSGVVATWSGSEYTLVWSRGSGANTQIVGERVSASGSPLDPEPITIAMTQKTLASYGYIGIPLVSFASASNGRDTIVITGDADGYRYFPDDESASQDAYRATAAIFNSLPRIESEPASRRRVAVASYAAEQAGGSIASNGTLSLVAWCERSGEQAVVRASFIAADGQVGPPVDLGDASLSTNTATASNGRDFLVVYFDAGDHLVARRVTLEGALDSTPILLASYYYPPGVALAAGWSGQAYVVMMTGFEFQPLVSISAISPDGVVTVQPQMIVLKSFSPASVPAVQCGATGCTATWQERPPYCNLSPCPYYSENNMLAFTNAAGTVLSQVAITDGRGPTPALSIPASDGRSVFVYSNGTNTFAGRVTAGGVVLDTPAVNGGVRVMTSETPYALQPVAVVNGGLYFVEPDNATAGRLYWTRVEPEPKPHVSSIFNLHQSVTLPVTLTASARNTYFVYSTGEADEKLMAPRLFLRTLASPDPQPGSPRRRATR
jgi:hypothetical protein